LKTIKMSSTCTSTSYTLACRKANELNNDFHLLECSFCGGNDSPFEDTSSEETSLTAKIAAAQPTTQPTLGKEIPYDPTARCRKAAASGDLHHILNCGRCGSEPILDTPYDPYEGYQARIAANPLSILESGRSEFHELPASTELDHSEFHEPATQSKRPARQARQSKKKQTLKRQPAIEMDLPKFDYEPSEWCKKQIAKNISHVLKCGRCSSL
jgi:hypothetical protein